jgi:hypothetical protein
MAFTITWDFEDGFQGWSFSDDSTSPTAFTSRTHDGTEGCICVRLVDVGPVNPFRAISNNFLASLSIPVEPGDTIEMDYGAPDDAKTRTTTLTVHYSDTTTQQSSSTSATAGTQTVTAVANKTIEQIECFFVRQCDGGGKCPFDITNCLEEVRVTTANEYTATAGELRTPAAFIEDEGAGAAGGAGGGSGGNLAAISADGLYVYIAAFNSLGFPTLIKIGANLSADGSVVFDPGSGGRIGVQTGELNAETVWVAGAFGGGDVVEKSDDAGASFTVKDDGSFGTVRTFEVGPGDDERLLVFDGDNGDILETTDDGETWTTINAAVSPLINSIARLSVDLQESIFGNEGDATDSINYSPNSGANLEDYQTGVYPNADATKVQVT